MQLIAGRLLRTLPFALLMCLTVLSACESNDDGQFVLPDTTPLDIWIDRDDITFIDATNVPQVQIDRFVAANEIDTTVTASGLVYEILDEGEGELMAPGATVTVNYRGYIINGFIFDQSTAQGPLVRPLGRLQSEGGRLIEAWEEGIPLMRRGGRMWMIVRPSLGYGTRGNPNARIGGNDVIAFEIELVDFENP